MASRVNIDLSATIELLLTVRAGSAGIVEFIVTETTGEVVDLTGADIKYYAATPTPIVKTVGSGIDITDPTNGIFELQFDGTELTGSNNKDMTVAHELKVAPVGAVGPYPLVEGLLKVEATLFETM